jgi:hypothetical protein
MERSLPRVLTVFTLGACAGLLAIASCTKTTDRVLEPVGGGDASTTVPEVTDASVTPLGPVARPPAKEEDQPADDFRLARSPELGVGLAAHAEATLAQALSIKSDNALGGAAGASGAGGSAGRGAPVSTGAASNYF